MKITNVNNQITKSKHLPYFWEKDNRAVIYLPSALVLCFFIFLTACSKESRPQNPKERFYDIQEVSFTSKNNDVKLAGEFTIPKGKGSYPAIILISGTGAQDRDETVFGHKPFLVISDYLTTMGFAVLRYDDRGVGESTGNYANADLYDFADDASGAYTWLEKQPRVNKEKIGYLGHSEGGVIAPAASLDKRAKFMILLAAPAVPVLPNAINTQTKGLLHTQGVAKKKILKINNQFTEMAQILKSSKSVDEARNNIKNFLKTEGVIDSRISSLLKLLANRWGMTYSNYDPKPALIAFKGPVLALFGGIDLQVSEKENAPIMKKVLSHPQSQVCVLKNKNHLFQNSKTGKVDEYEKNSTTIEPIVLKMITKWLKIITESGNNAKFYCS